MAKSKNQLETAFADVLRREREKRGLSQEALAHACGRHRTYISLLERAEHSASLRTLFAICEALGMRPSDFVRKIEATRS